MTDELARRMEKYAHAKRTVSECETWFKENWAELGNHDLSGMWYGARQGFTETYKPESARRACLACADKYGMPLTEILFDELDRNALKRVMMNPKWKDYLHTELRNIDPGDEGLTHHWGSVNFTPVKNRPSEEKYAIYDPGDEFHPEGYEDFGGAEPEPEAQEQADYDL